MKSQLAISYIETSSILQPPKVVITKIINSSDPKNTYLSWVLENNPEIEPNPIKLFTQADADKALNDPERFFYDEDFSILEKNETNIYHLLEYEHYFWMNESVYKNHKLLIEKTEALYGSLEYTCVHCEEDISEYA